MAFDMYAGSRHEKIGHHEESIFVYANESEELPLLNWLWENFYNGPLITFEQANSLVHELIGLNQLTRNGAEKALIERLLVFFSFSYTQKENVRCISD